MTRFNRKAEIDIRLFSRNNQPTGRMNIKNLRIAFQIVKNQGWATNSASVQIYNLSEDKRAQLNDYGDEITLFAGYAEESGTQLLFIGDSTRVTHTFAQPEIITSIESGDGEKILNSRLVSVSFSERVSARQVILEIARKVGLNINFFASTGEVEYKNGYSNSGFVKDLLSEVTRFMGLTWSIQNKNLIILEKDRSNTKPPIILDQTTGLKNVPERLTWRRRDLFRAGPKQGWRIRTTLRPDLLPGDTIRLKSQKLNLDENFVIDKVQHNGDTFGNNWESQMELIGL